ncbi:42215_t:CDS:2, partial [Gigaspora margarita]
MYENLTLEQIILKLKNNEFITCEKNGKSEVWQKFFEIIDLENNFIGYVLYKNCDQICTYSQKTGASHLLHHSCASSSKQSKITTFLPKKAIPSNIKESTINKLTSDRFKEFSQEIINIGAKWTNSNDYKKLSYISLTVHYIENWQLNEQILAISKFPNISHTGDNIKKVIFELLKSYNLIPNRTMERYVFITDSGTNFLTAFRNYKHLPCIAYNSLHLKLEKSLKQETETRWNIENIDLDILLILINFLKKFKEATNCLELSKSPTLHLVISWYKALKEHCKISQHDNEILKQIKIVVNKKLTLKYKISELHKLAVFFNPKMKQLKILEPEDILW